MPVLQRYHIRVIWACAPPLGFMDYAGYVAVNLMEIGVLGQDEGQFESYKACQLAFRTY